MTNHDGIMAFIPHVCQVVFLTLAISMIYVISPICPRNKHGRIRYSVIKIIHAHARENPIAKLWPTTVGIPVSQAVSRPVSQRRPPVSANLCPENPENAVSAAFARLCKICLQPVAKSGKMQPSQRATQTHAWHAILKLKAC